MSTANLEIVHEAVAEAVDVASVSSSRYLKNSEGLYCCHWCDKTAVKQSTMFYHEQSHSDTPSHPCALCDKGFVQRSSWLRHLATNHPETPHPEGEENPYATQRFSCPSCDREPMRTKQQLYVHYVRTHCKEVPAYSKDPCSRCSVAHNSAGAYLYHVPKCFGITVEANEVVKANTLTQSS